MADDTKRYYRKNPELFLLLDKIKLWPSKKGILHGISSIEKKGDYAIIRTYCGETLTIRNSRRSRATRWLRSKQALCACSKCKVPEWKLTKYSATVFSSHFGSDLTHSKEGEEI